AIAGRQFSTAGRPLRVLYAGGLSIRKGVPYLLQAVEPLRAEVVVTLAGSKSPEMHEILPRFRTHEHLPYLSKSGLREVFVRHDVLVMPTLGDSFGFVTVEAMASGLPVIASRHAGAPVPDEAWRVPAHDAEAIRLRLLAYHADRELLRHDSEVAAAFAAGLRPSDYRSKAKAMFSRLLAD
ncbi:MAG: glycosyltransferase family 4 protein, partial [Verrucomicrobiaceae bacterium]|nr:glycosyltransferase family 4 protein [Verrucomicrobiaceae bacterium]